MGVLASDRFKGQQESVNSFNNSADSLKSGQACTAAPADVPVSVSPVQSSDPETRFLSAVLQALPAGVVVLDSQGRIQECNSAAIALLEGPALGEYWPEVVQRVFAPKAKDSFDDHLKNGRIVQVSTCPMTEFPGQVLLINDVTDKRRLEQMLSQQHRLSALGQMTASLAHQLRTPLAAATLNGSQLRSNKLEPMQRQEIVTSMLRSMRRLETLVEDMLLFSRSGHCGTDTFTICSMVEEIENTCRLSMTPSIRFSVHANQHDLEEIDRSATLVGNRELLISAIQNLIDNAEQALQGVGEIGLYVQSNQMGRVDISVRDNGPGIPQHIQTGIFEPFYTTRSNGTGLGLAVVRSIARAHGGEAWVESNGKGSRFTISLPVVSSGNTGR
ncbi:MAG: ATP-binding protein [Gammaproteobacteria bacterium]|nr:ATP-binding protein [Gammaproteobacteria bacterium]MDH5801316.1 ATP-binding protein [Gammaproteobacteria bacterium]